MLSVTLLVYVKKTSNHNYTGLFFFSPAFGESPNPNPDQERYLNSLIERAEQKKLDQSPYWHILLHYRETLFGIESEADSPLFFNSPTGKTDPKAELEATIRAFFHPLSKVKKEEQHPQCRFIARYTFLNEQLQFDRKLLPKQECPAFEDWYHGLPDNGIALVFPTFDRSSPGSMFGHTLFHLLSEQPSPVMDFAINFAAAVNIEKESSLVYIVKGIFGGYPGFFSTKRYYLKIKEYSDIDIRDMWEYRLTFSPEEIRRLYRHLWELSGNWFDYFFFRENCSYQLLSLLESARPSLRFREKHLLWTTPPETVRQIVEVPGLVAERIYRPSRMSELRQKLEFMEPDLKTIFHEIIETLPSKYPERWKTLTPEKQATILEALSDYYLLEKKPERLKARREVIKKRAKLKLILPDLPARFYSTPPEKGHLTTRFGLGVAGNSDNETIYDWELRPSFHDFMADDEGFMPNSTIEFFKLKGAYNQQTGNSTLEAFTLVNANSLNPLEPIRSTFSWKATAGWTSLKNGDCEVCTVFSGNLGIGPSYELGNHLFFGFAETLWNYGTALEESYQGAVGVSASVLTKWNKNWKSRLKGAHYNFFTGDTGNYTEGELEISYQIQKNRELRVQHSRLNNTFKNGFIFYQYF